VSKWTAADIPDQSGRVAVVTGANSGLGRVTSRELARAGARVIMTARDEGRGREAIEAVRADVPDAQVELASLDLADLSSVREFAQRFSAGNEGLDTLVNNAGVMALPRRETADGFEMQFGTNHLGHFALTGLLLERLLAQPEPRVVTVSSGAHRMGKIDFNDLQGERSYRRWGAYGQSKLSNLLFARELQRRAEEAGTPLRSLAAHPGYAATNLQSAAGRMDKGLTSRIGSAVMSVSNRVLAQSDEMGALPLLYAATVPDVPGGSYVGPDRMLEQRGHPTLVGSSKAGQDMDTARRLWEVSEELTGVHYEFRAGTTA
jgi:NAD(P)-dependent dehydrogenase (short-subunit alcohol dehydrogenase family)